MAVVLVIQEIFIPIPFLWWALQFAWIPYKVLGLCCGHDLLNLSREGCERDRWLIPTILLLALMGPLVYIIL